jgi:hypothetical protein
MADDGIGTSTKEEATLKLTIDVYETGHSSSSLLAAAAGRLQSQGSFVPAADHYCEDLRAQETLNLCPKRVGEEGFTG